MAGGVPSAAAAAVSVIVLGSAPTPPGTTADDVLVVAVFDSVTTVTVTLLDTAGEPTGVPVALVGVDPFQPRPTGSEAPGPGLVPCAFGDSFSQVGVLTTGEAEFYNQFSSGEVDWAAHVGELVEFTAEITVTAYVRLAVGRVAY